MVLNGNTALSGNPAHAFVEILLLNLFIWVITTCKHYISYFFGKVKTTSF